MFGKGCDSPQENGPDYGKRDKGRLPFDPQLKRAAFNDYWGQVCHLSRLQNRNQNTLESVVGATVHQDQAASYIGKTNVKDAPTRLSGIATLIVEKSVLAIHKACKPVATVPYVFKRI